MKPKVALVFGEPGQGKSWLASRMCGATVHADETYIAFIKEKYPRLYLESLNLVVSQHYSMVLKATEKNVDREWTRYIMDVITERLGQFREVVVEGYLLEPILKSLRRRLSKMAQVTTVYVKDRHYFVGMFIKDILGA